MPSITLDSALCIAVDWGSSNLRAFLIDHSGNILAEKISHRGMLTLNKDEFEPTLRELVEDWGLPSIPIFMAGMVGSRGGWQEVPYLNAPVMLNALSSQLTWLSTSLSNPVAIVPGLKGVGVSGYTDVMRGEETQLLGVSDWLLDIGREQHPILCCLPGTHCKWAPLQDGVIKQFSTSFSGELFARLSEGSSLVKGLPASGSFDQQAFREGLLVSQQAGGLLHHLFSARSRFVSGELEENQVRDYLSGIVIGHDVNDMLASLVDSYDSILIIGGAGLSDRYAMAFDLRSIRYEHLSASEASIRGIKRLALNYFGSQHTTTGVLS